MAQTSDSGTSRGNTAVPQHGDHDRVAMLSLKADGTPDQHNPEIIGDEEFALAAAKEQFRQQAVSAVDVDKRGVTADTGAETVEQDPAIAELKKAHDAAASSAETAAEKTVEALHRGTEPASMPASAAPAGKGKADR